VKKKFDRFLFPTRHQLQPRLRGRAGSPLHAAGWNAAKRRIDKLNNRQRIASNGWNELAPKKATVAGRQYPALWLPNPCRLLPRHEIYCSIYQFAWLCNMDGSLTFCIAIQRLSFTVWRILEFLPFRLSCDFILHFFCQAEEYSGIEYGDCRSFNTNCFCYFDFLW